MNTYIPPKGESKSFEDPKAPNRTFSCFVLNMVQKPKNMWAYPLGMLQRNQEGSGTAWLPTTSKQP